MTKQFKSLPAVVTMTLLATLSFAQTPDVLTKAIQTGDEEKAISLIPGTDLNGMDKDGNTALTSAAAFYPKITRALVDAKANVNLPTKSGITPLFNACRWGNAESVKILLDAGADVNQQTQLGSALLGSFYYSSSPIVKLLLQAGAKFKEPVKLMNTITVYPFLQYIKTVKTPAEMVSYYGSSKEAWLKLPVKFPDRVLNPKESDFSPVAEVVKVFVENGLDVNQVYETNKVKETALDASMQGGLAEAAKVLMDNGANYDAEKVISLRDRSGNDNAIFPNLTYKNGDYVLGAVLSDKIDFVKFMVEKYPKLITKKYEAKGTVRCSDSNSGSRKDQTYEVKDIDLLMIAAEHGNADVVKYLIEKGAGKGKVAQAEWTGIHDKKLMCVFMLTRWTMAFAKNSGKQEIIDLVKAAGHSKD